MSENCKLYDVTPIHNVMFININIIAIPVQLNDELDRFLRHCEHFYLLNVKTEDLLLATIYSGMIYVSFLSRIKQRINCTHYFLFEKSYYSNPQSLLSTLLQDPI